MKHRINILFLALSVTIICIFFSDSNLFIPLLAVASGLFFVVLSIGVLFMKFNYFLNSTISLRRNEVLLSFDDGPDMELTPQVLDTLKIHGVKGIFFLIGKKAQENPALVKRIIDEGHLIGNHSYEHNNFMSLFSSNKLRTELERAQRVLQDISGKTIRFFRPPIGYTNPNYARVLKQLNLDCVGWRLRSYDSVITNSSKLADRITKRIKPGDIILLHDNRPATSKALEEIIVTSKKNGIIFVSEDSINTILDE